MLMRQFCPQCKKESDEELPFCPWCRFPQKTLAGKYRLLSLLGEGGMGILYHAEHIGMSMNRDRAIKLIPEALYQQPSIAKRLRREIEVTSFLSKKCDHIVQVYDDFGEEEGMGFFYVMELLSGKSLRDFLRSQGVLSFPVALHILGQICEAIHLAHQHDILHRDLKPENIFLIERAEQPLFVKVIDFGITRFLHDANTQITRGVVGTPVYMAPEQFGSTESGPRTDLYALALIFYEMLTGEVPFVQADDNPVAIGMKRLTGSPPSLSALYPSLQIPSVVSELLTQSLRTHPQQRPESVASFWAVLAPFAASSSSLRLPSLSSHKYSHQGIPLSSGVDIAFEQEGIQQGEPSTIPRDPRQNATLTPQEPFATASPRVPLWKNLLFGGLALCLSLVLGIWGGSFLMKQIVPKNTHPAMHQRTDHPQSSIADPRMPSPLANTHASSPLAKAHTSPSPAAEVESPPPVEKRTVAPPNVQANTPPKARLAESTKAPAEGVAPSAEVPAPWLQPSSAQEPSSPTAERTAPEPFPRSAQRRPTRIQKRRIPRRLAHSTRGSPPTRPKTPRVAHIERIRPRLRKIVRVERPRPRSRKIVRVERTREEIVAELQRQRDEEERQMRTTQQSGERGLPVRFVTPIKPPVMKEWTETSAERGLYRHQPDDHVADVRQKIQIHRFLLMRRYLALQKGGYSDTRSFGYFLVGVERQWQRAKQYLSAKEAATFDDEYALSLLMKSRVDDGLRYYKDHAIPIPDLYDASRHAERMRELLLRWEEGMQKSNPRISALAPRWWSCALLDLLRAGILSVRLIRAFRPSLDDQKKWPNWPEMMVEVGKHEHALQREVTRLFQESKRWTQKHRLAKWRCAVLSKGLGRYAR